MTVFVYEDVTATWAGGSGLPGPPAASLLAEGRAMLDAVAADFAALPGVDVLTWRQNPAFPVAAALDVEFRRHVRAADYSLIIAPETGGRLEFLCRQVVVAGGRLLGPSPDAVRLTADKLQLARHWEQHRVPTPRSWPTGTEPSGLWFVVKPRFGAGSQFVRLTGAELGVDSSVIDHQVTPMIAQEYLPGFAASVAFLIGPGTLTPLAPCQQLLSDDGRFTYLGGRLPIAPELAERAVKIATLAVERVPGLRGYVGVDLVLGKDGRDVAIEINPRLTTSYVGLRALARFNLAEAMLAALRADPLPRLEWSAGPIEFSPDGRFA